MYPNGNVLLINAEATIINHENAVLITSNGGELIRKVRIDYEWISDKPIKHFYEAEWCYLDDRRFWDAIFLLAPVFSVAGLVSIIRQSLTAFSIIYLL